MIKEVAVYAYCKEDISKIENYEKAITDSTQTWDCHHRAEILPCGRFSADMLIKYGLYYHRPANELIFLTHSEHARIHRKGVHKTQHCKEQMSKSLKGKMAWNKGLKGICKAWNKGIPMPLDVKERMKKTNSLSISLLKWWNNGKVNVRKRKCPNGFVAGRLKKKSSEN